MTPVSQTRFEANGQNGNCMQAAVASMLDLPLRLVPNFIEGDDPNGDMDAFFKALGYRIIERPKSAIPRGYYFATGTSTQGHAHIVICSEGHMVHDPNPRGHGLVKVERVIEVVPRKQSRAHDAMPETILKAVRPSAAIEAWYRGKFEDMVHEMARSMLLHMRAAWKKADPDIGFAADEAPTVTLRKALEKWGSAALVKFEKAAEEIGKSFASRSMRDFDSRFRKILREAGITVKFAPTKAMTEAYRSVIAQQVGLIKSIPQKFLTDVQTSVWQSVMKGSDMAGLEKAIQHNYGVTWRRAGLIARDQTHKARAFFEEARRSELGITEAIWVHSGGGHEPRPEHVKWGREKKRYDIKKGMWSDVDQQQVWPGTAINCFPGDAEILLGELPLALWRSPFHGPMINFEVRGNLLQGTPNHPILTPNGWVALGDLQNGDYVVSMTREHRRMVIDEENYQVTTFAELFESLAIPFGHTSRSCRGFKFYGDLPHGDVDEILPALFLRDYFNPGVAQDFNSFQFTGTNNGVRNSVIGASTDCCGTYGSSATSQFFPFLGARPVHTNSHGSASASHDSRSNENIANVPSGMSRHSKYRSDRSSSESLLVKFNDALAMNRPIFSDGRSYPYSSELFAKLIRITANRRSRVFDRSPGFYELSRLQNKSIRNWSGHVYTMETNSGQYTVSGAYVQAKNCRCISRSVFTGMTDVT